ncbi:MAG: NUDIX domain-containing protein [Brevundimonas sp.]|jgi:predicted NUDIX family NTP pyrophosphohydrolase|uniref:NUDIX domain-containing protein n=1 Tax=Brevundimonas sp. TaxID=1871086 RepID=UPI0025B7F1FC|nr:NUDIX domain-containing protein [Brevundimonas sp.]MCH4267294.1 NUDIX domain-containing protein [Brevundimonas sp.]
MKHSAALLLVRRRPTGVEFLLGHPGGPFWRRRDQGAWSVPKGLIRAGEPPLAAAFREFSEETGFLPVGRALPLPPVRAGRDKMIHPFALYGDLDPAATVSNRLRLEWPQASGRIWRLPELDRVDWFSLPDASQKILLAQKPILMAAAQADHNEELLPFQGRLSPLPSVGQA